MSDLGVTNNKDYGKSGQSKNLGESKTVPSYIAKGTGTEYQQVSNTKDYGKSGKTMQPDHHGHDHSETTGNGFKASPAKPEYQQVDNTMDYGKGGSRKMFPSEKAGESVRGSMPKVL